MKVLPGFVRSAAIRFCRSRLAPASIARRREYPFHGQPVSLHMVVGKDMCLLGMLGLRSLEWHTGLTWAPFIHDDGTLDDADEAAWKLHFPDCTVIRKARADEEVGHALEAFPSCRGHRLNHHWFLKVFDTRHYAPHSHYIVLDSDIVFFRRPDLVLDWLNTRPDIFYVMEDTKEKYSGARDAIGEALGISLMRKANSGFDLVPKHRFPLELAEKFLDLCAPGANHYEFLEQTIFGVMASAAPDGRQLPPEYEISWTNFRRRNAVCRHYVGPFKNDAFFVEGAASFYFQTRFGKGAA